MISVTNPEAIAAKHRHPEGISTKSGVLTGWPDSIPYPTQADIDLWESEYIPPLTADEKLDAALAGVTTVPGIIAALTGRTRGR